MWNNSILSMATFIWLLSAAGLSGAGADESVVTYHRTPDRSGLYVVTTLTFAKAAKVHRDTSFQATVDGETYGQPLYWVPTGRSGGPDHRRHRAELRLCPGRQQWSAVLAH